MTRPAAGPAEPESALKRLLEAESRLGALVDQARREGEALTAEAEARAVALAKAVAQEVAEAEASSAGRRSEAAQARFRQLALDRDASLARLDQNGSERVELLATWVTQQVLDSINQREGRP